MKSMTLSPFPNKIIVCNKLNVRNMKVCSDLNILYVRVVVLEQIYNTTQLIHIKFVIALFLSLYVNSVAD